jgi:hypothetical protein
MPSHSKPSGVRERYRDELSDLHLGGSHDRGHDHLYLHGCAVICPREK